MPADHPLRFELSNELHARPFARVSAPLHATHLAMVDGGEAPGEAWRHLETLCRRYGTHPPPAQASHFTADFGPFQLKWERHTEYTSYLFFRPGGFPSPFAGSAIDPVPGQWLDELPGQCLAASHVALLPRDHAAPRASDLAAHFVAESLTAALTGDGAAQVWTDFRIHEDGYGRVLIHDRGLRDRQAGRLIQRLVEIDTYSKLALLALPLAREAGPRIAEIDRELAELTHRLATPERAQSGVVDGDAALLARLTSLSADVERIAAATSYRFSAATAYFSLVHERIRGLREQRVEGYQTVAEFIDRRLAPAIRTCESVTQRQEALSRRATRAANLLRTQVDIALEAQNRDLLMSMNRRAQLQLRLQQTVEGLSVAAITYYAVGLVGHAARGLRAWGLTLDPDIVMGIAIAPVAILVAWGVHRVRRTLERADRSAASAASN